MDNLEQYIKMCNCPEIQAGRKWEFGDCVLAVFLADIDQNSDKRMAGLCVAVGEGTLFPINHKYIGDRLYSFGSDYNRRDKCTYWEYIWLPLQDQLQAMLEFQVGDFNDNFWSALDDFHEWAFSTRAFSQEYGDWIPITMEQLWLAFVMCEKYGKIWNGEAWIAQ